MITNTMAAVFSFITAVVISVYAVPVIIKVAFIKKLYDVPGGRKTHRGYVPNLGGVAIFGAFLISFTGWADFSSGRGHIQYILLGLILLHFLGVKDDIVPLAPLKKLGGQVLSAAILVIPGHFRLTDFHGIIGIQQLPLPVSITLSIFVVIVIINAFNLIDGVDGLAGGIALIISLAFSYAFWKQGQSNMLVATLALSGALIGFLLYNKAPARIFMGDAGSMSIGYLMAAFTFQFIQLNEISPAGMFHHNPAAAIAFLIIPLFDTLRVFTLRILHKRSPFSADCNHIHHRLLSLGLSHGKTSLTLYAVNVGFILLAYLIRDINPNGFVLVVVSVASLLAAVPSALISLKKRRLSRLLPASKPSFTVNVPVPTPRAEEGGRLVSPEPITSHISLN